MEVVLGHIIDIRDKLETCSLSEMDLRDYQRYNDYNNCHHRGVSGLGGSELSCENLADCHWPLSLTEHAMVAVLH